MDRAERRRRERVERRNATVKVGGGVVSVGLGQYVEATPFAELPAKIPGKHRWIATAGYVLDDPQVAAAYDRDLPKFLDNENLFLLAVGCYDCERTLAEIGSDSICPASGDE